MNLRHHVQGDSRRKLGLRVFLLVGGFILAGSSAALAFWTISTVYAPTNYAVATANSLSAGNQPSLVGINGEDVTINWAATTSMTNGDPVTMTGYTINRYSTSTGGTPTAATGGCSGTVGALTCTEQSVTPGTWYYTVTPVFHNWVGTESSRSSAIVVQAPTFSITGSQSLSAALLPANITGGSLAHFRNSENLTFHLDTIGGTVVSTTPSTVTTGLSGSTSGVSISIPANIVGGTHTLWAVGYTSGLSAQSNNFTVTAAATSLSPTSGTVGTAGVTISAKGFAATSALTVTVGGVNATITSGGTTDSNGSSTVTFTIPAAPHGAQAVVVSDGTNSATSATNFTVTQSATGLSPTSGPVGTTGVTILAQGFIASHALTVTVGGTSASITTGGTTGTNGATTVTFTIPAAPHGAQAVVVSDGTNSATSATNFTVTQSATGLSPTSGPVGTTGVTILAQGFIASHALTVTVGGTSASITTGGTTGTNGATTVTFTIPAAPHGAQAVVVSDGTNSATSATNFTVTQSATGLSPTSGPVGTTGVTILAQGFIASHALTVTVGGTSASITTGGTTGTNGATTVTFTIPAAPPGSQAVVVSDGTNSATSTTNFTVSEIFVITTTPSGSQTAGTQFQITLKATTNGVTTDTSYAGSHTITWTGPGTSPSGQAPSLPATIVSFTSGVSTTTLNATLYFAGSNTLSATETSSSSTGSAGITVNAGINAKLGLALTLNGPETQSGCPFSCTVSSVGKGGTFTGTVTVMDTWGNIGHTLATSLTVNLTTSGSTVSPSSVTIGTSGQPVSGAFTYTAPNTNGYGSETITASASGLTSVTATANN
jgi:hypothetical protein